ncbi:MAG: hypothetical protein KME13_22130 [Myxacorys californica WJT36-NPBG1]|nr:hypothetical protein [Myxacorys californica WJT36-NPBG1]
MSTQSIKGICAKFNRKHNVVRIALGTFVMSALALGLVPSGPASAGTCGQTFQSRVNGGEAAWSLHCNGNKITIDGWVKDTKGDGMCAWVKAFGNGGMPGSMPHAKACPKGKVTDFQWTTNGTEINAYLYVR